MEAYKDNGYEIKKFFLGLLVALGILFAYYAYASSNLQPPPRSNETLAFDYNKNTLFNSPGYPNLEEYDAFQERERQTEIRKSKATVTGLNSNIRCSCVLYAKWYADISLPPIGLAKYWPRNSSQPTIGGVVVFSGTTGHVAVILDFTSETLTIQESNYHRCQIGSRTISRLQTNILGFYAK